MVRTEELPAPAMDAAAGPRLETAGLSPGQMVGQIWGADKVQHYGWAEKGKIFLREVVQCSSGGARLGRSGSEA